MRVPHAVGVGDDIERPEHGKDDTDSLASVQGHTALLRRLDTRSGEFWWLFLRKSHPSVSGKLNLAVFNHSIVGRDHDATNR